MRKLLITLVSIGAMMAGFYFSAQHFAVALPTANLSVGGSEVGSYRPDFTLATNSGEMVSVDDYAGKTILINFWATWCAPCRREIPLLKTFQDEHGENGFVVIGIAVDFPDQVAAYAEEAEFNYPILVGQEDAMAVAETSGVEFIGMPFTMIVAADGELINTHIGEIMDSHLEHIVRVLTMLDNGEIDKASARKALNFL